MSDSVLNALVHLFALVASVNEDGLTSKGKTIVKTYLKRYLNEELLQEYFKLFEDYHEFYHREIHGTSQESPSDSPSLLNFQASNVSKQIKKGLNRKDRIIVFIQLLEFVYEDENVTDDETEIINVVADQFKIRENEQKYLKILVFNTSIDDIPSSSILLINNKLREWAETVSWFMKSAQKSGTKHIYKENLYGEITILFLNSINEFVFKYSGAQNLYIESQKIESERLYFLNAGGIIKGPNITPIYYNIISKKFFLEQTFSDIQFSGEDIEFKFSNSNNGIHKFSFFEESGNLIGVLGGSGVGKSTLLHIINGKIPPDKGYIKINGFDLYRNRFKLQGMIGFVPQDDLLIEELTVFQNLYYNAKLCFADYTSEELAQVVDHILEDLDLTDIAHLKVGNPLKKYISGGQRKRLNIGLELMREPYILILDEPTSGLSSSDSENIMRLLKDQTRKGRLVVATLHQPSSKMFKLLDKLWILDKGGYPVYSGNPIDAIVYFKKINAQVNAAESECPACGNINTEEILNIIETRTLDEFGNPARERKIKPEEWYRYYQEGFELRENPKVSQKEVPESNFKIPRAIRQFTTFSQRNFFAKLANVQYLAINLLEAPLLALVLGYFTKYVRSNIYTFQDNRNFPVFIFMSIVVALFMGLTISAEEIIKDRKILERETFLNLSWPAYLNSKIVYLFGLSAFQTLTYVIISTWILDIQGMLWVYWLILFSTSAFGNMIGLNISSGLDSVIAIYILIPLILVPQLLLGGAMIPFDDLNEGLTRKKYVPIIGDLMITRWAYEAITVEQFKANEFEKYFYADEQIISTANYFNTLLIPTLTIRLGECRRVLEEENTNPQVFNRNLTIVRNEFSKLEDYHDFPPFEFIERLRPDSVDMDVLEESDGYLYLARIHFTDLEAVAQARKDQVYDSLRNAMGVEALQGLQQQYYNNKLADIVMNRNEIHKIYLAGDQYIRKHEPIYIMPQNRFGRAQFYAPFKMLNNQVVETVWFNLVVMWLGSVILYFTLVLDVLRNILNYFRRFRLAKS